MDLPPEAAALLAVPPSRFGAERAAAARALADRGDPAAAAVRKLRRPVGLAWVLNRLSRDHPRELRALLGAGDRLRAGQRRALSGQGAEALREAEGALRGAARALRLEADRLLAAEGRPAPAATLARIELLLRVAATGAAREPLAAATLAREPEVGDAGLSGLTVLAGGLPAGPPGPAPRSVARRGRDGRGAPRRGAAGDARERERRGRDERKRAAQAAREAERRRKEHDRAARAAHREAARAAARAGREERAAEEAERRAREARGRAAEARAEASRAAARALEVERTGRERG